MSTINATMTTAAMATMETVDAATITRTFYPILCAQKPLVDRSTSPRRTGDA